MELLRREAEVISVCVCVCGAIPPRPHTAWWRGETQGQLYICKFFLRSSNSNAVEHCINYISEYLFSLCTFTHEYKPTCCKTTKFPYIPAHSRTPQFRPGRRRYLTPILQACQTDRKCEIWISSPFRAFYPVIKVLGWEMSLQKGRR